MKLKLLIGLLVVLIAVNLGTLGSYVYLQFFKKEQKTRLEQLHRPPFFPHERPDLKLEKEQRERLRQILDDFRKQSEPLRFRAHDLEGEMFSLMRESNVSREKLDSLIVEINEVRKQIMRLAIDHMIHAKSFLTPEQQEHFFDSIIKMGPGIPEGRRFRPDGPHRSDFDREFK